MNTQITEDYCSFEVAKLLKEKGFNEPTCGYYHDDYMNTLLIATASCHNGSINAIAAPTLQMAMKWLREEKHIFIRIIQSNIEYCSCEIYFDRVRCHQFWKSFDSYEEACEAAIKYCLTNLI